MNKKILFFTLFLATQIIFASDAETLFDNKCAVCHIKTIPTDRSKMIAPALRGIMRHVKMAYPNKNDAVNFIVDYALNPTKEKAVCQSYRISRFGLMPSQKGNVTISELEKIAQWMFDNYPANNFRGRGQGQGQGRGWGRNR